MGCEAPKRLSRLFLFFFGRNRFKHFDRFTAKYR